MTGRQKTGVLCASDVSHFGHHRRACDSVIDFLSACIRGVRRASVVERADWSAEGQQYLATTIV